MTQPTYSDRLLELLTEEATEGLSAERKEELNKLLAGFSESEVTEFSEAAALAQLSFLKATDAAHEEIPVALRDRISANAQLGTLTSPRESVPAQAKQTWRWFGFSALGWYAAVALAVGFLVTRIESTPALSLEQQVQSLLASCTDSGVYPWQSQQQSGYESVSGDVVWCKSKQKGFITFAHMPVNDPNNAQYQLWIVDPERDQHPVDGGVFDVGNTGTVIVPIDAKLDIIKPAAFAVTKEVPGGVVVSKGPLLIVAPVET